MEVNGPQQLKSTDFDAFAQSMTNNEYHPLGVYKALPTTDGFSCDVLLNISSSPHHT